MGLFNFFGENEHRVNGSLRDGHYQRTRAHMKRTQTIIGIVTMILICAVLFFIAKFYSLL